MVARATFWKHLAGGFQVVVWRYLAMTVATCAAVVGYILFMLTEPRAPDLPSLFPAQIFLLLGVGVLLCLTSVVLLAERFARPDTALVDGENPLSDPVLGLVRPFLNQDDSDEQALRVEQGQRIVEQTAVMMAINLVNALLVCVSLWEQVDSSLLAAWAVLVSLLALSGLISVIKQRSRPKRAQVSKRFMRRVTLHAGVRGLSWGICFVLFFGEVNSTGQLILMSVSLGMLAGGVPALALVPAAALSFGLGITVPTLLRLVSLEGGVFLILALFAIVFSASMVTIGCQLYRNFADNFLAQRAQREQSATISLLLREFENSASDWLWETNLEGQFTRLPDRMPILFGIDPSNRTTITMAELLDRAAAETGVAVLTQMSEGRAFREVVVQTTAHDGTSHWMALTASPKEGGGYRGVGSDITASTLARRDALEALERAKRAEMRLKDSIDTLGVGFVLSDTDDRTVIANKKFYSIFPAAEMLGNGARFNDIARAQAALWQAQRPYPPNPWLADLTMKRRVGFEPFDICVADGTWLRVEGRPTSELGTVTVLTDITDIKEKEAALALQSQRLAASNQELQQFAAVASHDLQEPLRKIEAFGTRLKARAGDHLDEEGRAYLDRMNVATRRMRKLITDLLAFSRAAKIDAPMERINLNLLITEVLDDLTIAMEEKQALVEVGRLGDLQGNHTQLRQLMQNLLSNSLKFMKPGVPPRISIERRDCDNSTFQIRLKDNGIGFDMKNHDRIFEIFQRLHGRDQYEGTGIGLATCRKIVERHGGAIRAESIPGAGTEFILTFPILETVSGPQQASAA
jgi:signal transduction histidine kinase